MHCTARTLIVCATAASLIILATGSAIASERSLCAAVDNGTGTAELPPHGCGYVSPDEVFMIIDGLPPGTTIELPPFLDGFICMTFPCGQPGGLLGGEREIFEASMLWLAEGTGDLAGFTRTLTIPMEFETHSAPRTPGDPVQSFATDIYQMQGMLPPGDPDFDLLSVVAGVNQGLPSPGQTTLVRRPGGSFSVDSFFDVTYRIDFVGAPGSILDGLFGSTTGTIRLAVAPPPVAGSSCFVPDSGTGTAELPPAGCEYRCPDETMVMTGTLPVGTTIVLQPTNHEFVCATVPCGVPGGSLGGDTEIYDSTFSFRLWGTGSLAGYTRDLSIAATNETHSGLRFPGDPVQFFNTDTFEFDAEILGDPDFASLHINSGTGFGKPSPGQTVLTQQPDGTFHVDSFFDITYTIDYVGAPGGILDGHSGSTGGRIAWVATPSPLFLDGFECGTTTAWGSTVP